jgi:hypothetical protein
MKRFILTFVLTVPIITHACTGYVIGFKGLNDAFDNDAFTTYSNHFNYCNKVYSWHQHDEALKFIHNLHVKYRLYGYSKGAATVEYILKNNKKKKPEYVITIGAYKTTNVNFDKYKVKYKNYFDDSGIGQKSPGMFLKVPHSEIQKEVNKLKGY